MLKVSIVSLLIYCRFILTVMALLLRYIREGSQFYFLNTGVFNPWRDSLLTVRSHCRELQDVVEILIELSIIASFKFNKL